MRSRLHRHREAAVMLACGLLLAGVLFYPALSRMEQSVVGYDFSEQYSGAWVNGWAVKSLLQDHRFPFEVDDVVSAEGSVIYALSLTTALISAPFSSLFNSAGLFNMAMVLNFLLALWASFVLFRAVDRTPWVAFAGALVFALSPFLLDHLAYGPLEGTAMGWIPLALWSVERFRGCRPGHQLLQGALIAAAFAADPYYGLFTYVAAGYLLLSAREGSGQAEGWRRRLRRAAPPLLLAGLLVAPLAVVMVRSFEHPRTMVPGRANRDETGFHARYITHHGVRDVASLALPTRRFHGRYLVHGVYLGLPVLLACGLALVRVRRSRRWFWLALGFAVFVLGGSLKIGGVIPEPWGRPIPLPAYLLCNHLPPFTAVTHPFRALPIVLLALGAMVTLLLARAGPRWRPLYVALFCLAVALDFLLVYPAPAPLPAAPYRLPAFHAALAREPGRFGLLDVPVTGSDFMVGQFLMHQLVHGKRVPYNLDRGQFGPDAPPSVRAFVAGIGLSPQEHNDPRDWAREARLFRCGITCQGARDLARMGYRYIALHLTPHPGMNRELTACLERCLPPPVHRDSQVLAYELGAR